MLCHGPLHTCFYFALSRATSHTFLLCFVTGHFTHVFTLLCHGPLHTCFYFALPHTTPNTFLPMLCHSNKCLLMLFTFHFKRVFVSFVKRHPDMFQLMPYYRPLLTRLCLFFFTGHSQQVSAYVLSQTTIEKVFLMLCHRPPSTSFCLCFFTAHFSTFFHMLYHQPLTTNAC